jgi:hypothetical protein
MALDAQNNHRIMAAALVLILIGFASWFAVGGSAVHRSSERKVSIHLYATGRSETLPAEITWGVYAPCGEIAKNTVFRVEYGDGSKAVMSFVSESIGVENSSWLENWLASSHTYNHPGTYIVTVSVGDSIAATATLSLPISRTFLPS